MAKCNKKEVRRRKGNDRNDRKDKGFKNNREKKSKRVKKGKIMKVKVRRRFSINYKLHCVHQFEKSKNLRGTAGRSGVTRCTLRNWVKNKTALQNVCNRSNFFLSLFLFIFYILIIKKLKYRISVIPTIIKKMFFSCSRNSSVRISDQSSEGRRNNKSDFHSLEGS